MTSIARYTETALEREVAAVAQAGPGGRNDRLNASAYALGQLVGSGCLDRQTAHDRLFSAARAAGLDQAEIRETLRHALDDGAKHPREPERTNGNGGDSAPAAGEPNEDDRRRIERARRIVEEARPPWDTLAETYLVHERGIPRDAIGTVLFHPRERRKTDSGDFAEGPAVVVPARQSDGTTTACQSIFLDQDGRAIRDSRGNKVKRTRGVLKGTAATFTAHDGGGGTVAADGPEDALSIAAARPQAHATATLGTAGIRNLRPRDGRLLWFADKSESEHEWRQTAHRLAELQDNGVDVYVTSAPDGAKDANDTLRDYGTDALVQAIKARQRRDLRGQDAASAAGPAQLPDSEPPVSPDDSGGDGAPRPVLDFSEDELADRFSSLYAGELRHVAQWGRWLRYDGLVWRFDETLQVFDLVRSICRDIAATAAKGNQKRTLASAKTVAAVERLAKADRRHAATVEQWDGDTNLLNTPGGVVDLRTGEMRPHRRDDHMTKITAVGPSDDDCPLWHRFLDTVTAGDAELQRYLQRMAGYALTGSTREHALFFVHGRGGNGKSVFLNTISHVLGEYSQTAPMDTFVAAHGERHPTELAQLRGARMVTAVETEEGRRWAESRIKALTGGDPISARFMRQDFFTFTPQFKLVVAGNHKPQLRNVDDAMRRRIHLIPFTVRIPEDERDDDLEEKLKAEWFAILGWMVQGAVEWGMTGLQPPETVRAATQDYFEEEDALSQWIAERCHVDAEASAPLAELFASWKSWAEAASEHAGSQKRFREALEGKGYEKTRLHGGRTGFYGLRPVPVEADQPPW